MEKPLLDYFNGDVNAVKVEVIISREKAPSGYEHIILTHDDGKELYSFWYNPKKQRPKDEKPKHSGGKPPYIMLMVQEIETLRQQYVGNVEELLGFLVSLGRNVEWNTGRLIHKRKKTQLKYADLLKMFNYSRRKLDRILKDLKTHDLLHNTHEGYFISPKLIKKGAARNGC